MVESAEHHGVRRGSLPDLPFVEDDEEERMKAVQTREAAQADWVLRRYFEEQETRAYVGINESIALDRHDLRHVIAPDVMVAVGVPQKELELYLPWKEGKVPDWVLEIASKSTAEKDRDEKPAVYHRLGVPELVLFDPEGLYHDQVLTVFRWEPEGYKSLGAVNEGRVEGSVLGLTLESRVYDRYGTRYWTLRFVDPRTGQALPTMAEVGEAYDRQRRELEAQSRALEAQSRGLEAQSRTLEAQSRTLEAQSRTLEAQSRELEQQARVMEQQARELEELRRKLGEREGGPPR